jgi:hypothetical protein
MVGVTGSIPVAPTISRPEKSPNPAHYDNCGGASSRLNKSRTVPRCLPDLGAAWAKCSRKVLDSSLNARRPASAEAKRGAHERSKTKSREKQGERRNPAQAIDCHSVTHHVPTKNSPKGCTACGVQFRPQRSTALFCSPRCRKAAQRARDRGTPISVAATRPSVAPDAVLSVTATIRTTDGLKPQSVTLRQFRKPPNINPRIAADPKWPRMYRIKRRDGSLTDMVSLTRAKEALL